MSLLMEALRKAEEAKRKGQTPHPKDPPPPEPLDGHPLSLVPFERELPPTTPASGPAPEADAPDLPNDPEPDAQDELDSYLQDETIDDDIAPARRKRVRVEAGARQSEGQLAAASIFAAKQQAAAPKSRFLKPALISLAVLVPVLGVGLWYLQQDSSGGIMVNPDLANFDLAGRSLDSPAPATAAPDEVAAETPSATNSSVDEMPPTAVATAETAEVPADPASDTISMPGQPAPAATAGQATLADNREASGTTGLTAQAQAAPVTTAQETPFASDRSAEAPVVAERSDSASSSRLQVSRSREVPTVNSTLQSAWNTLQAGDTETAARLYRNALAELPNNRDALLGLAVIHTRNSELEQARRLYAQALTLNPQDPLARTGLLQTMAAGNSSEVESELLSLLDSYPELAPVHFALGNLYAARQRWSDAQSAYFNALLYAGRAASGPISPDYAFNLAVSLEQLQQPGAALDYYRQAEELSRQSVPGFDPALLRSRLAFLLEQNLP